MSPKSSAYDAPAFAAALVAANAGTVLISALFLLLSMKNI